MHTGLVHVDMANVCSGVGLSGKPHYAPSPNGPSMHVGPCIDKTFYGPGMNHYNHVPFSFNPATFYLCVVEYGHHVALTGWASEGQQHSHDHQCP